MTIAVVAVLNESAGTSKIIFNCFSLGRPDLQFYIFDHIMLFSISSDHELLVRSHVEQRVFAVEMFYENIVLWQQ